MGRGWKNLVDIYHSTRRHIPEDSYIHKVCSHATACALMFSCPCAHATSCTELGQPLGSRLWNLWTRITSLLWLGSRNTWICIVVRLPGNPLKAGIYLISISAKQALGSTQPPGQWIPGLFPWA
jgi:hypothetical protein